MDIGVLVPVETLRRVKDEVYARIARLTPPVVPLEEGAVGEALAWALLFEHWPERVPGPPLDRAESFYNRYFWFKRFAALQQKRNGPDAALEQQVFKLLEEVERLDVDPDWALIERLDAEAANVPA